MCCTAVGWLGPALAPPAGLRTVGPLVLDMTAAAAAPETPNTGTDITLLQYAMVHGTKQINKNTRKFTFIT